MKKPYLALAILASALALSACGKTNRSSNGDETGTVEVPATTPPPCYVDCSDDDDDDDTPTNPGPTAPPLSYEFTLNGGQAATTGNITTDNVLKVKFRVGAEQGNAIHSASELKVTIAVGGTEVTPNYTDNSYVYGRVGETSNVINLSSYVTPGQKVKIVIKNPMNDFYCTYWGGYNIDGSYVNPLYNSYPGCRKAVNSKHQWSGTLLVQTSSTKAI